jgi:hypothetical protein
MLDDRTDYLLNFINRECSEGTFRIFSPSELLAAFPKKYAVDTDGLLLIMGYLKEREFILVKYADEESICLTPLPKGRLYHEERASRKKDIFHERKILWVAFLGSILGGVIGHLLALVISPLVGG